MVVRHCLVHIIKFTVTLKNDKELELATVLPVNSADVARWRFWQSLIEHINPFGICLEDVDTVNIISVYSKNLTIEIPDWGEENPEDKLG